MREPCDWSGVGYNQATESENAIHSDAVARQYGFRGGLVPGVSVYAYLAHPAVVAWGRDWLERGAASVVLKRPVYDGEEFRVETKADGPAAYRALVIDPRATTCAEGRVSLPEATPEPPARRGDAPAPGRKDRPPATRAVLEELRE